MNLLRVAIAGALAVVVTTGLLFVMHMLINQDLGSPEEQDRTQIGDIRMPNIEIETQYDPPKPDRPDEPDTPPEDPPEPEFDDPDVGGGGLNMAMPAMDSDFGMNVGGGFTGDGEFMPIVNVAPDYPRRAAQRGIEGFVLVRFTVTTAGTVEDVEVVESRTTEGDETSIFNRAAVRAAERFRFRPRVIDGEPVAVEGVPYRFIFELGES